MKRIIPILLVLLLLSACARAPQPTATPDPTQEVSPMIETMKPGREAAVKPGREGEATGETVTLDGVDSYLRLTLPEGWDWTEGETVEDRASLVLTPRTNDGFRVELVCWDSFGMCGTGVDFSEYTLPDGRTATLAVEKNNGQVWWTLILPESPDQFTIQFQASESVLKDHQNELDAMLESLQLGALSQLPPQPITPFADQ